MSVIEIPQCRLVIISWGVHSVTSVRSIRCLRILGFGKVRTEVLKRIILGVSQNSDEIPEHERKESERVRVHR
jgi:hypothetical protein